MLERIISRGVAGPELEALRVARVCGVPTGGSTRVHRGPKHARLVRRFGLSADACSRRQALLHNVRRADGTLAVGPVGPALLRWLGRTGKPVFHVGMVLDRTPAFVAAWADRFGVRALNVVGAADATWGERTRGLMIEVLQAAGRTGSPPTRERTQVLSAGGSFYAVALWPRQRAWGWDEADGRWLPLYCLPEMAALVRVGEPRRALWRLLPARVRPWVAGAPACELDLPLLVTLARVGKSAEDLARAGRWAVLGLVGNARGLLPRRQARPNALRRLLRRRQQDVIAAFGFPATGSAVRALAKVAPGSADVVTLAKLRVLLREDEWAADALRRLPRVNVAVVEVLSDPWLRRLAGPRYLREVAADEDDHVRCRRPGHLLGDLAQLRAEADRAGRRDRVAVIRSMSAFHDLLDELRALPDADWPAPPAVSGVPGVIELLATTEALADEGRTMRHCVSRYAAAVRDGRSLVFRVAGDAAARVDRATVELRPGADGRWHVAQLAGRRNAPVSGATRALVSSWLATA
jgi:hypothetical protein